MGAQIR